MKSLSFKVAKYALQDVLEALSNIHENEGYYNDLVVTKEDGDLVVMCTKRYVSRSMSASTTTDERGF